MDNKIPNWKLSRKLLDAFRININNRDDGNMYNINVLNNFISKVGRHSCQFVTADGGFDFSSDFNNQEQQSTLLLLCEIYTAINIQGENGHFLLKVFDIFSQQSVQLISTCSMFYKRMHIIKPKTSRPGNSEKYILFMGRFFDVRLVEFEEKKKALDSLLQCIITKSSSFIETPTRIYYTVLKKLTEYNLYYTFKQIAYIKKTLEFDNNTTSVVRKENVDACRQWCIDYNLEMVSKRPSHI
jgi:hypothetical protein